MYPPPTIKDVLRALKPLARIPRPEGDNEGDAINSESVMRDLTPTQREIVIFAEEILQEYTRYSDGQPNRRSTNTLTKNGFPTSLNDDQFDPSRVVGRITVGEWDVDLSDPTNVSEND